MIPMTPSRCQLTLRDVRDEPADLARVSLDNRRELRYWIRYFNTTGNRLHEAVSLMGAEVPRVRAYLRRFR